MNTENWHPHWFPGLKIRCLREVEADFFFHRNLLCCRLSINIWQGGTDETHSTSVLLRIPHRLEVTVWDSSIDPLPHRPTENTGCAPSLWLSIFHFCTLPLSILVCSILLLLAGKLLDSPVDTASSITSASRRRGFTAVFWPGVDHTSSVGGGGGAGGIPHKTQSAYRNARSELRFALFISSLLLISTEASTKYHIFISHY